MWQTRLGKKSITSFSSQEFHVLKREIFAQSQYYFESIKAQPRIADIGAHIGLASLYFKDLFPDAVIEAFEPNPKTFAVLEQNITLNGLSDVELHPLAVSTHSGKMNLQVDTTPDQWWSTASALPGGWTGTQTTEAIEVSTVSLEEVLDSSWDLVKMDIEGQESSVLTSVDPSLLRLSSKWLVEFHPTAHQKLETLISLFEKAGFSVELRKNGRPVWITKATGLVVLYAS